MSTLVAIKIIPEWCAWFVAVGLTIVLGITVLYDASKYSTALQVLQAYKRFLLGKSDSSDNENQ